MNTERAIPIIIYGFAVVANYLQVILSQAAMSSGAIEVNPFNISAPWVYILWVGMLLCVIALCKLYPKVAIVMSAYLAVIWIVDLTADIMQVAKYIQR